VKGVIATVFAAVGLLMVAMPDSHAGDRRYYTSSKKYSPHASYASPHAPSGQYERKCMTLSCGSTWCYNVRR
jgi:hypothetical protein